MKKLSPEICARLRAARRAAKLSQEIVADEVGCNQSALSMFEQGDGTKLSEEIVGRLAKKFGISLKTGDDESSSASKFDSKSVGSLVFASGSGFCPNPRCPANHAYQVEGRDYFKPDRSMADPVGGRFCAMCGETLVRKCPNCGAPVHDGGFCSFCGEPYVAAPI